MTRRQSDKMKRRAAFAALLSIAVFAVCLTGAIVSYRRADQSDNEMRARYRVKAYLSELGQSGTDEARQRALQELASPGDVIAAALLVDPQRKIVAAVPGSSDLVGRSITPLRQRAEERRRYEGPPDVADDADAAASAESAASQAEPEEVGAPEPPAPPVEPGRTMKTRPSTPSRRSRSSEPARTPSRYAQRRSAWQDEFHMEQTARELIAGTSVGVAAFNGAIIREPLTDQQGRDAGTLFVLPRFDRRAHNVSEAVLPLFIIGAAFAWMLYSVMLPWWVFLDARTRTTKAVPLALFVFLTNFFGWLTYLVIRPESDRLCPACDATLDPGFRLCPMCGWSGTVRCHQCGRPARPDWRFCPFCEAARPDVEIAGDLGRSGPWP